MHIVFICITFRYFMVSGSSLSEQVRQTPADIYNKPGEKATINCSHSIPNYNQILWYKQSRDNKLQFLGYVYTTNSNPEPGLNVEMNGSANKDQICHLTIEGLALNSSAVYFCAARQPSTSEAYFGKGTKLTVLEPGLSVTGPKVEVLHPSAKECGNPNDKATKKTIVCVARGFYPDHVVVWWNIDGKNVTKDVATDNAALREGQFYRISSRLSVSADDWFNKVKTFTCTVSFFDGKTTQPYPKSITGVEDTRSGMTREKYLMVTQTAKVSYIIFIIKSSIYGAFVAFLVWRLQRSAGKNND